MPVSMPVPVAEAKLPLIQVADGKTAQVIGKVAAVQGDAWIVRGGQKIAATAEAPLIKGDSVETADGGQISLVFADRSTFVLKDRGLIGLDEFTYDPASKTGSETILVAQGAFSFVSGDISKSQPGAARIATPAMSIGVRGTTVAGSVGAGGETSVALQPDPGSSFVGEIVLSRPGSSDPPLTISQAGAGVLGATQGSAFVVNGNAGNALGGIVPAPVAPPSTPPSLPASTGNGGGDNGGQGTSNGGGGDSGTGNGGNGNGGNGDVIGGNDVPPIPVTPIGGSVETGPVNTGTGDGSGSGTDSGNGGGSGGGDGSLGGGDGGGDTGTGGAGKVNAAPVGGNPTLGSGTEGGSLTIAKADLLAAVTDADGDPLTLGAISASDCTVVDNGDGTVTLTPTNPDFFGAVTVSYVVSDGTNTVTLTANAHFTNTPDAPVLGAITLPNGSEDTSVTFTKAQLLGGTTDADGDVLAVANVTVAAGSGTATLNADGSVTFVPAANFNGAVTLSYDITAGGDTLPASTSFTVAAVNDAPVMTGSATMTAIAEDSTPAGQTVASLFGGNFTGDADGDTLAGVAVIGNPFTASGTWQYSSDGTTWRDISGVNVANAQLLSATTRVRFVPGPDFNGTAPTLTVYGVDSSYAGAWSDSAANTASTINASTHGGSSVLAGSSTALGVTVTPVNDAPTVSGPVTLPGGAEDTPYTFTAAQLLANAADVDGDIPTVAAITADVGTVTANGGGLYTLTLPADYAGTVTFSYTIADGNGGTVAGTATAAIADAPDLGLESGGIGFTLEESTTTSGDTYNYIGDFNGDGRADVLIVNGTQGMVLGANLGAAAGSSLFSYGAVTSNTGVFAVGDVNGDGALDIIQRNTTADNVDVFLNDGAGNFTKTDTITQSYVNGLAVADINGDGNQDLVVMRSAGAGIEVFLGDGSGAFGTTPDQTVTVASTTSLTTGDINGDGDVDVIVGVWGGDTVVVDNLGGTLTAGAILDNHGTAVPGDVGSMIGASLVDLDGDGDLDLFAANRYVEGYWYQNDGTGNFTRVQLDSYTGERNDVVAADFDGDGDVDVLVAAYNTLQLWRNDGGGSFTDVIGTSGLPASLAQFASVADLDGDGDLDLVLQDAAASLTKVYSNNLVTASAYTEGGSAVSVFPTLKISDGDSATLTGAHVMIAANFGAGDVLSFTSVGGITGSYDAGSGMLTLSGNASLADYQAVLRSVTYSNSTGTMSAGARVISAVVTDGSHGSTPITQVIEVTLTATVFGSAGADTLDGGPGDNVYLFGAGQFNAGDSVVDSGPAGELDKLTLTAPGTYDLSAGTVQGIEHITVSGSGATTVVLGGGADPQQLKSIGGGTGTDAVVLADADSNLDLTGVTITSVETISTGAGNDTVVFDDVSTPGVGFVLDGDGSSGDSDTAVFHAQIGGSTLDVSAVSFSGIETVRLQATANVGENASYTGLDITFKGHSGHDEIVGGAGNDRLVATLGNDVLTGGGGDDTFVLAANGNSTVTDYNAAGSDSLELSNADFGLGSSGSLAATSYAESATAMSASANDYGAGNTGSGLVAIQNGADVQLWHTSALEGATTANSTLVATLTNVDTSTLDNTSFHLAV